MNIVISNTSETPLYMQIYEQICAQIITGEIEVESCLPPIRTVAKELRISVIPVKMAWEELERGGFIYTMAGKGCFVAPLQSGELNLKRDSLAYAKMKEDIAYYRSLGLSMQEIIELVKRCYNE